MVDTMDGNIHNFSQSFSCPDCGISVDEIEPRSFSFNNPFGACPDCLGLGYKMEFDIDLIIPDRSSEYPDGAIVVTDGSPAQMREAFPGQSWMLLPENMISAWQHLLRSIRRRYRTF